MALFPSSWRASTIDRRLRRLRGAFSIRIRRVRERRAVERIAASAGVDRRGYPLARLLRSWAKEPRLRDEQRWTAWAKQGFRSWNGKSPEREFCRFAAALVEISRPSLVLETGVGQGFVTRRVANRLPEGARLICYESDPELRTVLGKLPFFDGERCVLSDLATPSSADFARAQIAILDSAQKRRLGEILEWSRHAPAGSYVLIHDTGNGHEPDSGHGELRAAIDAAGIVGLPMPNPRGSFLGYKG